MQAAPDLASVLTFIADDLERRCYSYAGAVRQGARRIVELEANAPRPDTCERCGASINRKSRGRPRQYCSERCRRKRVGNSMLVRKARQKEIA